MSWEYDTTEPAQAGAAGGENGYGNPAELLNHLLLVWAVDYIEHAPTRFSQPGKKSDVIVVDIVDLDLRDATTQQAGAIFRKAWWRNAFLIRDLKGSLGALNPKLCAIGKGVATTGLPPYVLIPMHNDPMSRQRADAWRQTNLGFTPSLREGQAPPPPQTVSREETPLERMARMASTGQANPPAQGQVLTGYMQDQPVQNSQLQRPPLPKDPPF